MIKKLKLIKKNLIIFVLSIINLISPNFTLAMMASNNIITKNIEYIPNMDIQKSNEEAQNHGKEMAQKLKQLPENAIPKIIVINPGGDHALQDPIDIYRTHEMYDHENNNKTLKANDVVTIMADHIIEILTNYAKDNPDKNIFPVLTHHASNAIDNINHNADYDTIFDKIKPVDNFVFDIPENIQQLVEDGTLNLNKEELESMFYDTYLSADNHLEGAGAYFQEIAKTLNWPIDENGRISTPEKSAIYISLQTNSTEGNNEEGIRILTPPKTDPEFKRCLKLGQSIYEYAHNAIPEEYKNIFKQTIQPAIVCQNRKIPQTKTKYGIDTIILWVGFTDNPIEQAKLLDKNANKFMAKQIVAGILNYYNYHIEYANLAFALLYDRYGDVAGIKIQADLSGDEIDKLEKGSILLKRADDETAYFEDKICEIQKNKNIIDETKCSVGTYFDLKKANLDWKHNKNNEFYVNVYLFNDETNSWYEIMADTHSFIIKPEEDESYSKGYFEKVVLTHPLHPSIEKNTVFQGKLKAKIKQQNQ